MRDQLERLLAANSQAKGFLSEAPIKIAANGPPNSVRDLGSAGQSVLASFSAGTKPTIVLNESPVEEPEPIIRPASDESPKQTPDCRYQIQGEIARGGMGAIMHGRNVDLGRNLAIKVLLDAHKDKPDVVHRFIEEAQIGGQLQHPGIAPVYELGKFSDMRPYFTMKLVKGKTLAMMLLERRDIFDRGKLLGIFEQICQTMAYAHSRRVVHRDLKPANIMIGAFGEVQVMDWGLAKVLSSGGIADEKKARDHLPGNSIIQTCRNDGSGAALVGTDGLGSQTMMGSVMGTPGYMSPEQALGEVDRLDERLRCFRIGSHPVRNPHRPTTLRSR